MTPEICDIVMYGDDKEARYRVNGWLKRCPKTKAFPHGWQWCLKDEAEGVSLTGICGALAALDEVTVVGRVAWDKALIKRERDFAISLGKEGERIF